MNATPPPTSFARFMALAVLLWTSLPVHAFTSTLTGTSSQPLATTTSRLRSSSRLLYSNGDNAILPAAPTVVADSSSSSLAAVPTIQSLDEWQQYFATAKQTTTVVRFYSETCRACKQATPAFARLVSQHSSSSSSSSIQFVQVPATVATKELFQHVGVTRMPWAQVYDNTRGNHLVHQGSVSRSKIASFRGALDKYLSSSEEECRIDGDDVAAAACYNYAPTFAMA